MGEIEELVKKLEVDGCPSCKAKIAMVDGSLLGARLIAIEERFDGPALIACLSCGMVFVWSAPIGCRIAPAESGSHRDALQSPVGAHAEPATNRRRRIQSFRNDPIDVGGLSQRSGGGRALWS